jgi:hypothetical protein
MTAPITISPAYFFAATNLLENPTVSTAPGTSNNSKAVDVSFKQSTHPVSNASVTS